MNTTMLAMRLHAAGCALSLDTVPRPAPGAPAAPPAAPARGARRPDLHLLDGELPDTQYPITPGHEIVGRVGACGRSVESISLGDRLGVPWLGYTCGRCRYCEAGQENLCEFGRFTGYTLNGGYAELALADARYCLPLPSRYSDAEAAPLLCAGLIGYRAYRAAGEARNLGLHGFGAAAHLLAQIAKSEGRAVFAFTRPGDSDSQAFARSLGDDWAGGSDVLSLVWLVVVFFFVAAGVLLPTALRATRKGARVVCAGIHMSDIPSFSYELLWGERSIASVANLTRADGAQFMRIAERVQLRPSVELFK